MDRSSDKEKQILKRFIEHELSIECTSDWAIIDLKVELYKVKVISGDKDSITIRNSRQIFLVRHEWNVESLNLTISFKSPPFESVELQKGDNGEISLKMGRYKVTHNENIKNDPLNKKSFKLKSKVAVGYPEVLIFLPTKGHAQFLKRHLENYFKLDYPIENIRMVIVYGESNDDTEDILKKFVDEVKFKCEIYKEPFFNNIGGISSHFIADLCEGLKTFVDDEEIIVFMDDDVVGFPSNLLKEAILKLQNPEIDIVAPYVYIENTDLFWDTFVFKDINGKNFDLNPPEKNSEEPLEISSAGTCLIYNRRAFLEPRFENPAPHMRFCETARTFGFRIWGLPYIKIIHADVRSDRKIWDESFGGHERMSKVFQQRVKSEKKEIGRTIMETTLVCSFCGNEEGIVLGRGGNLVYCPKCKTYVPIEQTQERTVEIITYEYEMRPMEFSPITRDDFELLYESIVSKREIPKIEVSIFAYTGYGGLASVPSYMKRGLSEAGIETKIFPLNFNNSPEQVKQMVRDASNYILYYHYDKLASVVSPMFDEAEKLGKKIIVFPSDAWMDVNPEVRKEFYKKAFKIISYAEWIKTYCWDGECKSYSENPNKIIQIRFGVRKGRKLTKEEKNEVRNSLNVKTKYLIGEIAFVREGKGFLYPMLKIIKENSDFSFMILGSEDPLNPQSDYVNRLKNLIRQYGIEDRVIWLNHYIKEEEIDKYLGSCDVLVIPTTSPCDTSGALNTSIGIEGGKCVITTSQRTRREIKNKYDALVLADFTVENFSKAIKKALINKGKIESCAKKYVTDNSWEKFAERVSKEFLSPVKQYRKRLISNAILPKILLATAIKFDTNWQKEAFEKNIKTVLNMDYPLNKIKFVYMCASKKEISFIKSIFPKTANLICILDPKGYIERIGKYAKHSVHFYAPLFNAMREEITEDIEYVFLVDGDYVNIPKDGLKKLLEFNVDIISPYLMFPIGTFFDVYGFATTGYGDIYDHTQYTEFDGYNPPYKDKAGIYPLAYAGTGIQLIRAEILKKIPWVNPDSWIHWCWQAREKGYVVWVCPTIKFIHGMGYIKEGKRSDRFSDLILGNEIDVNKCIEMELFTREDWDRMFTIKWATLSELERKVLWDTTIGKWKKKDKYIKILANEMERMEYE